MGYAFLPIKRRQAATRGRKSFSPSITISFSSKVGFSSAENGWANQPIPQHQPRVPSIAHFAMGGIRETPIVRFYSLPRWLFPKPYSLLFSRRIGSRNVAFQRLDRVRLV